MLKDPQDLGQVGPFVRLLRTREGIGLREFARRTGVQASNLCVIEQGKRRPGIETARKLLAPFGYVVRDRIEIGRGERVKKAAR